MVFVLKKRTFVDFDRIMNRIKGSGNEVRIFCIKDLKNDNVNTTHG